MEEERKSIISVRNLRKVYHPGSETVVALDRINLEIYKGEICSIFGTSGSGKSTFLNQLAGLEKPTEGEVLIGGVPVSRLSEDDLSRFRQRYFGFIFQAYNLIPTMNAIENVAAPLMFRGVDRHSREKAARQLLKAVGLGDRMTHYPSEMSGGQQQRVGIARALIAKPKIIFADEPTGNLDTRNTMEVMELICSFAKEYGSTVILVTHDPEMAKFATRIVTLIDGNIKSDEIKNLSEQENGEEK
ncbi:MAG: ABC transporter ATP-binding protein [Firmicutes bacterium]|nr:ABC transporter ATP-binding protein [Bacillota bacterium]MBQ9605444.1 ABC transporter ATP-binding protein [Bacillota bacterium]